MVLFCCGVGGAIFDRKIKSVNHIFLFKRCEEDSKKYLDCQNELVQQRRKNAMLEKQVGKNKIESGPGAPKGGSGKKKFDFKDILKKFN